MLLSPSRWRLRGKSIKLLRRSKNSLVRSSLIVSRSFAAFSNSNRLALLLAYRSRAFCYEVDFFLRLGLRHAIRFHAGQVGVIRCNNRRKRRTQGRMIDFRRDSVRRVVGFLNGAAAVRLVHCLFHRGRCCDLREVARPLNCAHSDRWISEPEERRGPSLVSVQNRSQRNLWKI